MECPLRLSQRQRPLAEVGVHLQLLSAIMEGWCDVGCCLGPLPPGACSHSCGCRQPLPAQAVVLMVVEVVGVGVVAAAVAVAAAAAVAPETQGVLTEGHLAHSFPAYR